MLADVELSVFTAIAMVEGLLPYCAKTAYIYQRDSLGVEQSIPVPIAKIMSRKSRDLLLLRNDILYVPEDLRHSRNYPWQGTNWPTGGDGVPVHRPPIWTEELPPR